MAQSASPREVVIVAYPGVQSLDVTGPLEVFAGARGLVERAGRTGRSYRVRVLSRDGARLSTSSGLELVPAGDLRKAPATIDTLIVAGGPGFMEAASDKVLIRWIAATARRARRTASVCTGAFLLAEAGLLDRRRATTHWAAADELARRHPSIEVDADPIYMRDGAIWTSAGVTAGMDLSLALIEVDLGREAALAIARQLVLFLRRPGGQSQFSAMLAAQEPERGPIREVLRLVVERPAQDLAVDSLAARAHMSPRNFSRVFHVQTGLTPARYVARVRLEAARRRLEDSADPVAMVAEACGFGTPETMRRSFIRALGVGPAEYRRRFKGNAPELGVVA